MIRVVKATDELTDDILGAILDSWDDTQIAEYVERIKTYYGFPCSVFII